MDDYDWVAIGKGFVIQILWGCAIAGLWVLAVPGLTTVTGYEPLRAVGFVTAAALLIGAKFTQIWFTHNRG